MESIMAQSMYFGLSFSRVGADFRPQLVPIFLNAIENYFVNQVDRSEAEFKVFQDFLKNGQSCGQIIAKLLEKTIVTFFSRQLSAHNYSPD